MATIRARKQANGFTRYTAIIRLRKGKVVIHREAKTFAHRAAALTWARHREVELEDPAAVTRAQASTQSLARVIRWYIDTFESISR